MNLIKVIKIYKDFVPQYSYRCDWHYLWKVREQVLMVVWFTLCLLVDGICFICVLPVRRIPEIEGSTVPFSRILLSILRVGMVAKDVDEVRQGVAVLQHWDLAAYARRLPGGSE